MKKFTSLIIFILFSQATHSDQLDTDRNQLLEREVRKLTNRVEILEHELTLIKNSTPQSVASATAAELGHPRDNINEENRHKELSQKEILQDETVQKNSLVAVNINKEKQQYDLALSYLKEKEYLEAKKQFADFIAAYPKSSMLGKAMFWYSETFFQQKDYNNAALNYLKCYQSFPKGEKAQDSLLKLATSLSNLGRKTKSCQVIAMLEKEFPNRSAAAKKIANDLKLKDNCK